MKRTGRTVLVLGAVAVAAGLLAIIDWRDSPETPAARQLSAADLDSRITVPERPPAHLPSKNPTPPARAESTPKRGGFTGGVCTGRVVASADGSPIAGATVLASNKPPDGPRHLTGADGRFRITIRESDATPMLLVRKDGFIAQRIRLLNDEETVVRLSRGANFRGRVLSQLEGKPIAGVRVTIRGWNPAARSLSLQHTTPSTEELTADASLLVVPVDSQYRLTLVRVSRRQKGDTG